MSRLWDQIREGSAPIRIQNLRIHLKTCIAFIALRLVLIMGLAGLWAADAGYFRPSDPAADTGEDSGMDGNEIAAVLKPQQINYLIFKEKTI